MNEVKRDNETLREIKQFQLSIENLVCNYHSLSFSNPQIGRHSRSCFWRKDSLPSSFCCFGSFSDSCLAASVYIYLVAPVMCQHPGTFCHCLSLSPNSHSASSSRHLNSKRWSPFVSFLSFTHVHTHGWFLFIYSFWHLFTGWPRYCVPDILLWAGAVTVNNMVHGWGVREKGLQSTVLRFMLWAGCCTEHHKGSPSLGIMVRKDLLSHLLLELEG